MSAKVTLANGIVARSSCLPLTGPADAAQKLALVLRLLAYLGGRIEGATEAGKSYSPGEIAASLREIDRAVTSAEFGDEEDEV